jgi:hypothetical protein
MKDGLKKYQTIAKIKIMVSKICAWNCDDKCSQKITNNNKRHTNGNKNICEQKCDHNQSENAAKTKMNQTEHKREKNKKNTAKNHSFLTKNKKNRNR